MQRFCHGIRMLVDSTRATAVMETAIVAPVLAGVAIGTIDVSRWAAAKLNVQQGINRGLEMAMIKGPGTSTSTVEDEAEAQAGSGSTASARHYQYCGSSTTEVTWGSSCSGQEIRKFMSITLTKDFRPSFAMGVLARRYADQNGNIPITATGVIRIA